LSTTSDFTKKKKRAKKKKRKKTLNTHGKTRRELEG